MARPRRLQGTPPKLAFRYYGGLIGHEATPVRTAPDPERIAVVEDVQYCAAYASGFHGNKTCDPVSPRGLLGEETASYVG